jgi:hypothetical protein
MSRRPFLSLKDRLALYAKEVRVKAALLPPGIEREALLSKASKVETASKVDDWINSPGLQAPKFLEMP